MTGFLHEKEFSRKTFLKGGGALIVGFSVAGLAGKASRRRQPVREQRAVRPERGRLVPRDPREQHGHAQVGPRRARPGHVDSGC